MKPISKRRRVRAFAYTRLGVDPAGDWKACTPTLPKGCTVLGTVSIGADTGALVRLPDSRNYVKVTHGRIDMLNQCAIDRLLDAANRTGTAQEMVSVEEWERD